MMKYEEPNMVILEIEKTDVVTASELQITDPSETENSNWGSWF